MLLVETISLLQAICGFGMLSPSKKKLSLRFRGGIIGLVPTKKDVDQVRKYGKRFRRLNRRKFELKWKDNFVFNKSTEKTRIRLSRLILHKKETPKKRIDP